MKIVKDVEHLNFHSSISDLSSTMYHPHRGIVGSNWQGFCKCVDLIAFSATTLANIPIVISEDILVDMPFYSPKGI